MPPKQPPPKKLTRKEMKEKQLEEQRIKEEQDRIKREEDEKKRLEEERLRKLEEERLAAEEKARLQEEEVENEVAKGVFKENLENAKKLAKANEDWDKFVVCSTKPDIVQEAQLTTFVTMFRESKPVQDMKVFEELGKLQQAESVIREIYRLQAQLQSEKRYQHVAQITQGLLNADPIIRNKHYIKELREYMFMKLEQINTHMIVNADTLLEEKMAELLKKVQEAPTKTGAKLEDKSKLEVFKTFPPVDDLRYGVWIYPSNKNPGYRHKPNDFAEITITSDIPRQIIMFIQKVCWTSFDWLSPDTYSKDRIIGGIVDIEYLQMLPAPKKVNNWTLKQNYDLNEQVRRHNIDFSTAIKVSYMLPTYLWIPNKDSQKVWRAAVFDRTSESWQTESVEEAKLDKGWCFNVSATKQGPIGLLQERCSDYPYESFKLRSVGVDRAMLDIVGKRDTFKFEIGAGYIRLLKQDPEFQQFAQQKMNVGALFYELYRCGVNFMPVTEDCRAANIIQKDEEAEELAIMDLSEAVRGYFIESSKWNNSDTAECIVAKLKENPEFDEEFQENQEKDWKSVKWWPNKCAIIQAKDSQPKCNQALLQDTETHCNLEVVLKLHQLTSPEIMAKMKDLHYAIFIETIQQVLRLTRLLSFTVKD